MKKILFLILVLLFAYEGMAQFSHVTVFSKEATPFYLILNGVRQNEQAQTNIRVEGLTEQYYQVKVIFADQKIPVLEKKYLPVVDPDGKNGHVTYVITEKKGNLKLKYYSFTPAIDMPPPTPEVVVVSYNTTPMPEIVFTETVTTTTTGHPNQAGININVNDFGVNASIQINDGQNQVGTTTTTTTTTTTQTIQNAGVEVHHNEMDVYPQDYDECQPMNGMDFNQAKTAIKAKSFAESKLTMAKQISSSNCLTSDQVRDIMEVFSFEDSKLEFAKYAYDYCYDPNNYWKVNDAFDFESSIDELNEYLNGPGRR